MVTFAILLRGVFCEGRSEKFVQFSGVRLFFDCELLDIIRIILNLLFQKIIDYLDFRFFSEFIIVRLLWIEWPDTVLDEP